MLRLPILREKDNDLSLNVVYITKIQFSAHYNSHGKCFYSNSIKFEIFFLIKIEETQKLKPVSYI